MKFDEIKNLQVAEKHYSKKEIKKSNTPLDIKSICRYGNLAIILMNARVKGSLRELSKLINDGVKPCSWTIRISFYENEWMVSLAPHDEIDKSNININVFEKINSIFGNTNGISVIGNMHTVFLKTKQKEKIEDVVNYMISVFNDIEISGIKNLEINKKFTMPQGTIPYSIKYEYSSQENAKTDIKNKELIESILKYNVSQKDVVILNNMLEEIKENKIINSDTLNSLSQKYCSDKERLHIAIKFMS